MAKLYQNRLEGVVLAVSSLLVLAVLGILIVDAFSTGEPPADLRIRLGTPSQKSGHMIVPVTVRNEGGTAGDVVVEVTRGSGPEAERSEVTFLFVPERSEREGFVAFTGSPAGVADSFSARVVGYVAP